MIEKIFIPTVCRPDRQITYSYLPDELKKRVVFVVQEWEREKYTYDAEYLVLPPEIKLGSHNTLSHTREIIYKAGQNMKYAMLDDDLHFKRRNAKYWTGESNMEKSSKLCDDSDVLEMFETFDKWLDDGITFCGCAQQNNPPFSKPYEDNRSLSSCYWFNGKDWAKHIDDMGLTDVKVGEDVLMILGLLSRGYRNRVSNEFIFANQSIASKKEESVLWDSAKFEEVHEDHKIIEKRFPKYFKIVYNDNDERAEGGFRDFGKLSIKWSQAYKDFKLNNTNNTLDEFLI